MKSRLYDVLHTSEYYQEYVNLFNQFKNISTSSIFIRYYKIDKLYSDYNKELKSTDDRYFAGLRWNVLDYTPTLSVDALQNDYLFSTTRKGHEFSGDLSVVTFTICEPTINDLIVLPYKPNNKDEVFRVKEISTTLAYNNDGMHLNVYRLGLEYANLTKESLDKLNINGRYVYLIPNNKYIQDSLFKELMEIVSQLTELLKNEYFNIYNELYDGLSGDTNILIYEILTNNRELFPNCPIPFGIKYQCALIVNGIYDEPYNTLILRLFEILKTPSHCG